LLRPLVNRYLPAKFGLTAWNELELEELRLDKDRLLRQSMTYARTIEIEFEVQELKNQNAQLIEDHTRMSSLSSEKTQLVRAKIDCEAAEQCVAQYGEKWSDSSVL